MTFVGTLGAQNFRTKISQLVRHTLPVSPSSNSVRQTLPPCNRVVAVWAIVEMAHKKGSQPASWRMPSHHRRCIAIAVFQTQQHSSHSCSREDGAKQQGPASKAGCTVSGIARRMRASIQLAQHHRGHGNSPGSGHPSRDEPQRAWTSMAEARGGEAGRGVSPALPPAPSKQVTDVHDRSGKLPIGKCRPEQATEAGMIVGRELPRAELDKPGKGAREEAAK